MSVVRSHEFAVCTAACPEPHARRPLLDRRRLISGIGAAWAAASLPVPRALAAGSIEALLLNCIDYRLTAATTRYMSERKLEGQYDQFILAGASLGVDNRKFPDWGRTFWDHVQLAIDLHGIKKIIVMDHRDCGFYKAIHGKDHADELKQEFDVHAVEMRKLKAEIARKQKKLEVELLLMGIDGKVETVA